MTSGTIKVATTNGTGGTPIRKSTTLATMAMTNETLTMIVRSVEFSPLANPRRPYRVLTSVHAKTDALSEGTNPQNLGKGHRSPRERTFFSSRSDD